MIKMNQRIKSFCLGALTSALVLGGAAYTAKAALCKYRVR